MNDLKGRIKNKFDNLSKDQIKVVMKKQKKFIKIYNNLCPNCKRLVMVDSYRPMSDYCDDCQKMMVEVLS